MYESQESQSQAASAARGPAFAQIDNKLIVIYPDGAAAGLYETLSAKAEAFDPQLSPAYLGYIADDGYYFRFAHPDGYGPLSMFAGHLIGSPIDAGYATSEFKA
jgi:hypothetical protein